MAYTYTRIDGQRVEEHVAAAYQAMNAAFAAQTDTQLLITSGTRTREEQAWLYDQYLHHGGTLAAAPGYSNHEEDGPIGPIALDLRDSGADAGVAAGNNPRADWLKANSSRFGFRPAGYTFSTVEPWHYEYTVSIACPAPDQPATTSKGVPDMFYIQGGGRPEALVGPGYYKALNPETAGQVKPVYQAAGAFKDFGTAPASARAYDLFKAAHTGGETSK